MNGRKVREVSLRVLSVLLISSLLIMFAGAGLVLAQATTVTSVSPNSGNPGQTLDDVTITGTDFDGVTVVNFGADITVTDVTFVSSTVITADIAIVVGAALGTRDVLVTATAGTDTLTNGFVVMNAVTRDLPNEVVPGETFDVVVTFAASADDFKTLGLHDEAPDGGAPWPVAVDKTWCTPEAFTESVVDTYKAEYTWMGPYSSGAAFSATYEVTVPADTALGTYTFADGELIYYIGTTEYSATINGENQVEVIPPTEVWVDDGWTGYSSGDPADGHIFGYDAFATIQDGINAVTSSTVNVLPGTYNENITIDKELILQSTGGAEVTIIDGGGVGDVVEITGLDGDTVTFSGFTVRNSGLYEGIAVWPMNATNLTIEDNVITDIGYDGINFADMTGGCVVNITGNDISGLGWEGIDTDDVIDSSMTIEDNTILDNGSFGIKIVGLNGSTLIIGNNDISNTRDSTGSGQGIYFQNGVWGDSVVAIEDNTISGNANDGIDLNDILDTAQMTINNNTISENIDEGIEINSARGNAEVTIENNTITGSGSDGVDVEYVDGVASAEVVIRYNTISGNNDDGVEVNYQDHDYQVTVSPCNDIFDNGGYGVNNDGGEGEPKMVDATENWWGDASGPSGEGPGSGDAVSENVDYEPWLLAPCGEEEEVVEEEVVEEVAPGPSRFSHRNLNVSPVQTYSNQPVTISMVVANTGESRGSVQINLTINGTIEQSKRITIDSGSSKRLEFTVMKLDPGTYDFYVGRLQGQFHVIATAAFVPPPPPPSPLPAIPDTTGQLGTGGIIAIVIIGIMVIGGLTVAFMMTRRA